MTLTKSWLQKQITDLEATRDEIPFGLDEDGNNTLAALKMALAGMEAEAVYQFIYNNPYEEGYTEWLDCNENYFNGVPEDCRRILYTTPQPLTTSERAELENYRNAQQVVRSITQHFDDIALETAREIICDVNRRHEFLGGEVQLLSRIQCRVDDACRAAMLQGKAEPVTTACKLPPHVYRELVNSLRDTAVKYQGCQQLREQISETLSAVITHTPHCGNPPMIPDGWVACSERMPDVGDVVLTAKDGFVNVGEMERSGDNYRYFTSIASGRYLPATHWQPLPAAPQQEAE